MSQNFSSINLSTLFIPTKTEKKFDHDCFHTPTYITLAVNSSLYLFSFELRYSLRNLER